MLSEYGRISKGWKPIPVEPVFPQPQPPVPTAVKLTLDREQLVALDRLLYGGRWPSSQSHEWTSLGGRDAGALLNLIHNAVVDALSDLGEQRYNSGTP